MSGETREAGGGGVEGGDRGAETTNYPAVPEASSPRCHDTTTTKWRLWCNPCAPSTASSTSPSPCSQPSLTLFSEYEPGELAAGNKGWWACGMGWGGFLVPGHLQWHHHGSSRVVLICHQVSFLGRVWGGHVRGRGHVCRWMTQSPPPSLSARCPSSSLKESGQLWLEAYLHQ